MAHNLGLGVVAEGVESQAILDKLTAVECECTRVNHKACPMVVDIFDDWFRECSKNKKFNASTINSDFSIKKLN
jgi:EAL domain-containing protein (putative c-di-GMP-specific phosphodiesterase class I)